MLGRRFNGAEIPGVSGLTAAHGVADGNIQRLDSEIVVFALSASLSLSPSSFSTLTYLRELNTKTQAFSSECDRQPRQWTKVRSQRMRCGAVRRNAVP